MLATLLYIVVLGVVLYLIENYVPMSAPIKTVFRVVVAIFAILLLLSLFGVVRMPGTAPLVTP